MIKISASIVIYKEKKETLKKIIESFLSISCEKELIIVDNSPYDSLREFCEKFDLKYIFIGKNLGFGKAHNLAFRNKTLDSDIYMVINPDTYFEKSNMESFLSWFYSTIDISLAVPLVYNPDKSLQKIVRYIPTPIRLIKRKLGIDSGEIVIKKDKVTDIPCAHGCFLVFKTAVYEKINGFDERYFMYMEDIDIFLKAKKYGRTVINSKYYIYHEHRKGSSKNFKLMLWHLSSAVKFFFKFGINPKSSK